MILEDTKMESKTETVTPDVAEESDSDESVKEVSSEGPDSSDDETSNTKTTNLGWADQISKILQTKKPKGKKTLVLSKAKKLTDIKPKEKPKEIGFEIDGEIKEEKPDPLELLDKVQEEEPVRKKVKKEEVKLRVKPNILDKDRERTLQKIATRGVVQLFNAVRSQQKDIEQKLDEAGPLERKKEKVLKSVDKREFLNVLMGTAKSQKIDEDVKEEEPKEELQKSKSDGTNWNVLREDFMMGAKYKDWDKEDEDEED